VCIYTQTHTHTVSDGFIAKELALARVWVLMFGFQVVGTLAFGDFCGKTNRISDAQNFV